MSSIQHLILAVEKKIAFKFACEYIFFINIY